MIEADEGNIIQNKKVLFILKYLKICRYIPETLQNLLTQVFILVILSLAQCYCDTATNC